MEILMKNGKIKIKKLWKDLGEYEMNKLKAKVNAKIVILEKKKTKSEK